MQTNLPSVILTDHQSHTVHSTTSLRRKLGKWVCQIKTDQPTASDVVALHT